MKRPELGTWCAINATAHKSTFLSEKPCIYSETRWLSNSCLTEVGMFIGYRFVFDGQYHSEHKSTDIDGFMFDYHAPYFEQTKTHEVWLFVVNARQNPIYAFPCDVVAVEQAA